MLLIYRVCNNSFCGPNYKNSSLLFVYICTSNNTYLVNHWLKHVGVAYVLSCKLSSRSNIDRLRLTKIYLKLIVKDRAIEENLKYYRAKISNVCL